MNKLRGSGFGVVDQEADRRKVAIFEVVFHAVYAYDGLPILEKAVCAKWSTGLCLNLGTPSVVGAVEVQFNDV
jgi:hypothetical protein